MNITWNGRIRARCAADERPCKLCSKARPSGWRQSDSSTNLTTARQNGANCQIKFTPVHFFHIDGVMGVSASAVVGEHDYKIRLTYRESVVDYFPAAGAGIVRASWRQGRTLFGTNDVLSTCSDAGRASHSFQ